MTANTNNKWNSLLPRVLTAIVGGTLVIFCLAFHALTALIVVAVISLGSLSEFYSLSRKSGLNTTPTLGLLAGFLIILGYLGLWMSIVTVFQLITAIMLLLFTLTSLELLKNNQPLISTVSTSIGGIVYCLFPPLLLHYFSYELSESEWKHFILCFIMVWAFDSGAYFSGKLMGRTKLLPAVSPGKTVEGVIGGIIISALAAGFFCYQFNFVSLATSTIVAVVVSVFGTLGDLTISQFKRYAEVKDTGTLLPGHGGFLDRFDGFLLAAVSYVFMCLLF
ncbi:MAG: phosphatidate cytidylyltransferase [Cyclobacteriaceae bacterium]